MVVLFHLSGNLSRELAALLPEFVMSAMSFGYLGVPIFFVISGLVIALSVGKTNVTLGYFGNFALRRSIRLDPTYWAAILIAIVLMNLKGILGYADSELPSASNVLFHMFYLQDIVGVTPQISSVYWTLCLEIQLYLFYILALYVSQLGQTSHNEHTFTVIAALFAFISILSD